MAKTKKKRKTGAGTAIYVVILTLWILFLAAVCMYILSQIWAYASVYDETQVEPVIESYMDNLRTNLWDDSIAEAVEAMPHPMQSNEEVQQLIREILMADEISCKQKTGAVRSDSITYHLLCGENAFGEVTLTKDTSKNLVENINLPSALVGALAKMGVSIQPELYPWKVTEESFDFSGLYSGVGVTVPKNYRVTVNGVTLSEESIVEKDIHFDNLEPYYYRYDNLPTKVRYKIDNLMGHVDPVIYDEAGKEVTIDPKRDDSQFMTKVDNAVMEKIRTHIDGFSDAYLHLSASTGDPNGPYSELLNYIEPGSEMDKTLKQIFLIGDWSHNSYYQYKGSEVIDAWSISGGFYLVDYYARATVNQPAGPVDLERHLRSIIDDTGDHMVTATIDDI